MSLKVLEQTRKKYQFVVAGYVAMPEHVHLLIEPHQNHTGLSRSLRGGSIALHFVARRISTPPTRSARW